MAERHDVQHILKIARELVHKVQSLMDKWQKKGSVFLSSLGKTRVFPGLHLSRVIPGSPGLLSAQVKAPGVVPEHLWSGPALELSLNLFTCTFCPLGMPMLSVQTCGIVCMLVSLITLWKHSSVYLVLQRLCACMKTHSLTHRHTVSHTPPVFQAVALLDSDHAGCLKRCSLPRRGSHKWPNGLCQLPDRECFLQQACVFLAPLFFFKRLHSLTNVAFMRNSLNYLVALFGERFLHGVCEDLTGVGGGARGTTTGRIGVGCEEWTLLSAMWWPQWVYSLFQVKINHKSRAQIEEKSTLSKIIYGWGF